MNPQTLSRRDFLKTSGIVLGSTMLAGTGLTACGDAPETQTSTLPEYTFGEKNMSKRILVTYASQGGSTAGVAEAIGKALADGSAQVDVRPVNSVTDLTPYQSVVIGSAVHSGQWMPEALEFVERNQSTLRRMPTVIFQVCMMLAQGNEQYKSMVPEWLTPLRNKINPVAEGSFAGALFPNQYPKLSEKVGLRIFLAFIKTPAGDYRDWDAIRTWAEGLRPALS